MPLIEWTPGSQEKLLLRAGRACGGAFAALAGAPAPVAQESGDPRRLRAWLSEGVAVEPSLWDSNFPGRGAEWWGCSCSVHVCSVSAAGGMEERSRQRPSQCLWTFQLGFLGRRKLRALEAGCGLYLGDMQHLSIHIHFQMHPRVKNIKMWRGKLFRN